jgi:hypothetical protein
MPAGRVGMTYEARDGWLSATAKSSTGQGGEEAEAIDKRRAGAKNCAVRHILTGRKEVRTYKLRAGIVASRLVPVEHAIPAPTDHSEDKWRGDRPRHYHPDLGQQIGGA